MPKERNTIITLSEDQERVEHIRLRTGPSIPHPSVVPHEGLDEPARALLKRFGWTRVPARRDLWYGPNHLRSGLVDRALKEKAELDRSAREKGERLARERALKAESEALKQQKALATGGSQVRDEGACATISSAPPCCSAAEELAQMTLSANNLPNDRAAMKERATARVMYALVRDSAIEEWQLIDALMLTESSIDHAFEQWFRGRILEAEQVEDVEAYLAGLNVADVRTACRIAYMTTMDLLHEVWQDVYVEEEGEIGPPDTWDCEGWT